MKPKLFIGSSREGLAIADAIHAGLTRDAECTVWNQGIFNLSQNTLFDLIKVLRQSDFGIFVFSPDDIGIMRGNTNSIVRDNVIFELGLFIGRLGPERSFFLIPDNIRDLRLPSDLTGITPGEYEASRSDNNWYAAVGPACGRIRRQMESLKSFQDVVSDVSAVETASSEAKAAKNSSKATKDGPKVKKTASSTAAVEIDSPSEDGEGIKASKYKNSYLLSGETKPYKEIIKSFNGRWIGSLGGWTISPSRLDEIKKKLPKMEVED